MQQLLLGDDLIGGVSPNPAFPSIISLDLQKPLGQLDMYTNNLDALAAPRELCVQKALELTKSRMCYELNLEAFRMELLDECLALAGEQDINALVKGIQCIGDYLLASFDNHMSLHADSFPYEFYCLHNNRYLFLSKIVLDASLSTFRSTAIAKPAYTYPEVQARNTADYITQTDQCVIL
jgi:hypothetical protein